MPSFKHLSTRFSKNTNYEPHNNLRLSQETKAASKNLLRESDSSSKTSYGGVSSVDDLENSMNNLYTKSEFKIVVAFIFLSYLCDIFHKLFLYFVVQPSRKEEFKTFDVFFCKALSIIF